MKKLILVALVIIIAGCVGLAKATDSTSVRNVKIADENLKLVEVPEFTSFEEDIRNLSNIVIYQLVDVKEFEEFTNSPNRLPYAYVVGIDMEAMKKAESERKSPNESFSVKFEKVSHPIVKPDVWHIDVPISGANLQPGYGNRFGPYSGYIYVSFSLTWNPSNEPIDVGIQYTGSSTITAHRLIGGSGSTGFNVDASKSFYAWVINPEDNSANISSYQGMISLWAQ
ncbi:hypothetical protein [Caldisericum exile]|uniref:Uncharacterized protein n=1 Tax=Caldisericum exile (strain DSM 21853 / NBRC 104410 / AZM16c01) TaxID=511051 RepID=A0A7U6GD94_CALEA|nr:hypothetical protein [Caldisericum exile]BAL80187.1 hypothetical protein CSE_00610 [Caldisericum exile AZM16c01]